jgi:CBS domain-containing protein
MSTVREAMVSNPGQLPGDSSAQAAGELLQRPEVRAVYVTEDERLVGVVTRKTLVREVVALGRSPQTTPLREIAEEPNQTIESAMPLADAFALLEERDLERVPVVEDGKLVGIVSARYALDPDLEEFVSESHRREQILRDGRPIL